ncbi:MAG: ice-binding family protein [Acidimicrobiales bacterium]|nr:ice-binding family protein [Acidimicrobiales bacterium]
MSHGAAALLVAVAVAAGTLLFSNVAGAATQVGLGTADSFAVLAGAGVTNTGSSVISGNLGTCPTPAVTGFPPGIVQNGTIHANDALACSAQSDLVTAYNNAAGQAANTSYGGPTNLGGMALVGGVYRSASSFSITGTLTLDAQGDSDAVWIFQASTTLITAVNSNVSLINGAQACNVFWQVGSSATLGVGSTLVGSVLALTSITANTNATVRGRLLARNGATTLDTNRVSRPGCSAPTTTTTTGATTSSTSSTSSTIPPGSTSSTSGPSLK